MEVEQENSKDIGEMSSLQVPLIFNEGWDTEFIQEI